jgi:peptide/nickel transport system substrate-binding protein
MHHHIHVNPAFVKENRMARARPITLLVVAAFLFSACAGAATGSPATNAPATNAPATQASAAAPTAAAATPVNGGTLIAALDGDIAFTDSALIQDSNSSYVASQVVEGLVGLKPGTISGPIPVLAASMPTVSSDGLTYTFALRTGITFHDGTVFNAAAVKFNYDRWKNFSQGDLQDNAYYYWAIFGGFGDASNVVSTDAPDATTVVFHLRTPQSNFLISQTLPEFGIESPTALQNDKADTTPLKDNKYAQGQGESMVGTGPFMYKEWVPGDHITLVKNPHYWDPSNAAHLDQIVFKPIGDSTAKLQALQSGGIDFAESIAPSDVKTAQSSGLTVIDRGQSCDLGYLGLNENVGGQPTVYANKDVRLAIAYAVNKQAYIDSFFGGQAVVPQSWAPPAASGFKAENLPGYNPTKAKQYLQQSGLTDSQRSIDLYYPTNVARPYMPDPKSLALAIANDLQAVGFTVNFKTEDWHAGYVSDATNGKLPMFLFGLTCDYGGADDFIYTGFFGYVNGQPNPHFRYRNDAMNADMIKAMRATSVDAADQLWGVVQDMLAADMPTIPLVNANPPAACSSRMHGFVGAGNLTEYFNSVWLSH